jgi:hypothetical protein
MCTYAASLAVKKVGFIETLIIGMDTGFRTVKGTQSTLDTLGSIVGGSLGSPVSGAV